MCFQQSNTEEHLSFDEDEMSDLESEGENSKIQTNSNEMEVSNEDISGESSSEENEGM